MSPSHTSQPPANFPTNEKPFTLTIHRQAVFTLRPLHDSNVLLLKKPFNKTEPYHLKHKTILDQMLATNVRHKQHSQQMKSYSNIACVVRDGRLSLPLNELSLDSTAPSQQYMSAHNSTTPLFTPVPTRSASTMSSLDHETHSTSEASLCQGPQVTQNTPLMAPGGDTTPPPDWSVIPSTPFERPSKLYLDMDALFNEADLKVVNVSESLQPRVWKPYFNVNSK